MSFVASLSGVSFSPPSDEIDDGTEVDAADFKDCVPDVAIWSLVWAGMLGDEEEVGPDCGRYEGVEEVGVGNAWG